MPTQAHEPGPTPADVVRTALDTLDRRSAPPSVITNGHPLALAGKFLPRRLTVRFMGRMARRQPRSSLVALTGSSRRHQQ
ncbi:hypothetical protein [Embleya sp. NPDC050493]|uniref:hypothetical protein n=1 Tax=Embleya sp. NPDC050493 TaxID=3363989 RepID=UPI00379E737D